ncbi:MAG TPA: sialidase family protein [Steroidobacteraceae bacterium]|nr:sialidase family protein [Steroidobacteraceae bacterium]
MDARRGTAVVALLTLVAACGGGDSSSMLGPGETRPSFTSVQQVRVSQPPTYGACNGATQSGTLYDNTALEPSLAINPTNSANLIAEYQQGRWDTGGSQALQLAVSFDGGTSWNVRNAAFSVCTGGSPSNTGNYLRASNGWLSASPAGIIYAMSLSFSGAALQSGSSNAQLVSRSIDGGNTWSLPIALISDGASFFNDKGSITADPTDSNYVYAVWDRLTSQTAGATYFTVSSDEGTSWQSARSIYDPGPTNQTISNVIVVLTTDVLIDVFMEIDTSTSGTTTSLLRAIRSSDHGSTWSAPVTIAQNEAVGAFDPLTRARIRDSSLVPSVAVSRSDVIYVVWQDARFSKGDHDGIALSSSIDGGTSWSEPIEVNGAPNAVAFTPTINVRGDGTIGITYYDLRNDLYAGAVLTDCWLVTSTDGSTFKELHLAGPFDLNNAPRAELPAENMSGLFLGDYQALASTSSEFLPLSTQTGQGSQTGSDVFVSFPPAMAAAAAARAEAMARRGFEARQAPPAVLEEAAQQRVMRNIRRAQSLRLQSTR